MCRFWSQLIGTANSLVVRKGRNQSDAEVRFAELEAFIQMGGDWKRNRFREEILFLYIITCDACWTWQSMLKKQTNAL
jgi:hypothetical protein